MPSPFDDIAEEFLQWRREIEERVIHTSVYNERHHPTDSASPPVIRIDTTEITPGLFSRGPSREWVEQPFPSSGVGACCAPDGTCSITTASGCTGCNEYHGDGTTCNDGSCPTGICCDPDGNCTITTERGCVGPPDCIGCGPPGCSGCTGDFPCTGCTDCSPCNTYQGDDPEAFCDSDSCPTGACCAPDGTCSITTETACNADCQGGTGDYVYQGDGTECDPNPCTGACCADDGSCTVELESDCTDAGGTFQGVGTTCDPNPCPTGACCVGTDCSIHTEVDCTGMGGTYQGNDTTCDPNPCLISPCCVSEGIGFAAYDGSGRRFLTKTTTFTASYDDHGSPFHRTGGSSITTTETYNNETCTFSCSRSGGNSSTETDERNGCITLQCDVDGFNCFSLTDHRIAHDSHNGTDCTLVFDGHITNSDLLLYGESCPNSGCCPPVGFPGTDSSTATTHTISGSSSIGSFMLEATLSDECV